MTIIEAINRIDSLKQNTYSQTDKVAWLSTLDSMVKTHIIDTHEGGDVTFTGYDENTDIETVLLIPAPYDEAYLRWMEAQIDYHNREYGSYNNAIEMFNTTYKGYQDYYNRTHMPKGRKFKYFGGNGTTQQHQTVISAVGSVVSVVSIDLPASAWVGSGHHYSQVVAINGVTAKSQVNLTPSVEQLAIFYEKDISFVTENDGGVVTVHIIGQKPENDYTIQANIVEVKV